MGLWSYSGRVIWACVADFKEHVATYSGLVAANFASWVWARPAVEWLGVEWDDMTRVVPLVVLAVSLLLVVLRARSVDLPGQEDAPRVNRRTEEVPAGFGWSFTFELEVTNNTDRLTSIEFALVTMQNGETTRHVNERRWDQGRKSRDRSSRYYRLPITDDHSPEPTMLHLEVVDYATLPPVKRLLRPGEDAVRLA